MSSSIEAITGDDPQSAVFNPPTAIDDVKSTVHRINSMLGDEPELVTDNDISSALTKVRKLHKLAELVAGPTAQLKRAVADSELLSCFSDREDPPATTLNRLLTITLRALSDMETVDFGDKRSIETAEVTLKTTLVIESLPLCLKCASLLNRADQEREWSNATSEAREKFREGTDNLGVPSDDEVELG